MSKREKRIVACENPNRTGYGYRWSFEKHDILTIEKGEEENVKFKRKAYYFGSC